MSTNRTATARIQNMWGVDLAAVTLRHTVDGNAESYTWSNVAAGSLTDADFTVHYVTGFLTSHDYWWVSFQVNNGDVYTSKDSFYCDLTADDDGGVVTAIINAQNDRFTIMCPQSSGCDTDSIAKQ